MAYQLHLSRWNTHTRSQLIECNVFVNSVVMLQRGFEIRSSWITNSVVGFGSVGFMWARVIVCYGHLHETFLEHLDYSDYFGLVYFILCLVSPPILLLCSNFSCRFSVFITQLDDSGFHNLGKWRRSFKNFKYKIDIRLFSSFGILYTSCMNKSLDSLSSVTRLVVFWPFLKNWTVQPPILLNGTPEAVKPFSWARLKSRIHALRWFP